MMSLLKGLKNDDEIVAQLFVNSNLNRNIASKGLGSLSQEVDSVTGLDNTPINALFSPKFTLSEMVIRPGSGPSSESTFFSGGVMVKKISSIIFIPQICKVIDDLFEILSSHHISASTSLSDRSSSAEMLVRVFEQMFRGVLHSIKDASSRGDTVAELSSALDSKVSQITISNALVNVKSVILNERIEASSSRTSNRGREIPPRTRSALNRQSPAMSGRICFNFIGGTCKLGDKCSFAHRQPKTQAEVDVLRVTAKSVPLHILRALKPSP